MKKKLDIKVYWFTNNGNEWMEETLEIDTHYYQLTIQEWYEKTRENAYGLWKKWTDNGEVVGFYPGMDTQALEDEELIQLQSKAYQYIDELDGYY